MKNIYKNLDGIFLENFDISVITHYKIGGKIDLFARPKNIDSLRTLLKNVSDQSIPFFLFGKGSNLLISDEGFRGIFVSLEDCCNEMTFHENGLVNVGAGIIMWDFIQETIEKSLGDMTNMSLIPGTIGGALYMNAGAFGSEIEQFVENVTVIDRNGKIETIPHERCGFSYRKSKNLQDKIILGAKLKLQKTNQNFLRKNSQEIVEKRENRQPLDYPSCGSVFKRPEGNYAGTLIEKNGLKGKIIGGAKISEKHANFILNFNNAKASDVRNLIKEVQKTVKKSDNILLETEVKMIGF
jgi:UDP-N-acetylmuramate dehydrogenase